MGEWFWLCLPWTDGIFGESVYSVFGEEKIIPIGGSGGDCEG